MSHAPVDHDVTLEKAATAPSRPSRRALLGAGIGGLLAAIGAAVGRPAETKAAAGNALVIGSSANNAGTSNTILTTSSSVVAFQLIQNGPGTAVMGYVKPSTGATRGVYGRTDSPDGDGVQARNAGPAGPGAALRAIGMNHAGVVGTTSLAGLPAIYGENTSTSPGTSYGVFGRIHSDVHDASGVGGEDGGGIGATSGVKGKTFSVNGSGVEGVATANTLGSYGVFGVAGGSNGFGIFSTGDAEIYGDLTVTGTKTGYVADVAVNGSATTLRQGDPVTLLGVRAPVLGAIPLLVVGRATHGDAVIGVMDRKVRVTPAAKVEGANYVKGEGISAAPEDHLFVVTLGAFAVASVDAADGAITPGTRLSAGSNGKLVKAKPIDVNGRKVFAAGEHAGYALGSLPSGRGSIGIFVNPH